MPDISMCPGTHCAMRDACYRYRALPSKHQAYSDFTPLPKRGCEYLIPLPAKAKLRAPAEED